MRRPLCGAGTAPIDEPTVEALAGWADGRLDASHPAVWAAAPEALQAILADRHGWAAVHDMTWREALLSLQLLAEERVGASSRRAILEAKAAEDAAFDSAV